MAFTRGRFAWVLIISLLVVHLNGALAQSSRRSRTPVFVELFTSEGCSSCPPADALLGKLDREQPVDAANIIVFEEHVDYWEGQGWHDRFSSAQFTDRQTNYQQRLKFSDPYTPQMVVDGSSQFLGSDSPKALNAIAEAAGIPKISLTLAPPVIDGRRVTCSIMAASSGPLPKGDLYAAVVQATASTEVKGGENGGRHLNHVGVVRSLRRVGKVQDLGSAAVKFNLEAPADLPAREMRVVVFAQAPGQGPIQGAAFVNGAQ
jgi:hypothetical protein